MLILAYSDTVDSGRVSHLPREFHPRKKRKIRAAFTTYQTCALENWFSRQKYLTTTDRDQIAKELHLSAAQVVTVSSSQSSNLFRFTRILVVSKSSCKIKTTL